MKSALLFLLWVASAQNIDTDQWRDEENIGPASELRSIRNACIEDSKERLKLYLNSKRKRSSIKRIKVHKRMQLNNIQ